MVRALLDMRAVVDDVDHVGRSALHVAVRGGHLGVLGVLLKRGADANLRASVLRSTPPVLLPVLFDLIYYSF
jgi:ankyrin repeat protein